MSPPVRWADPVSSPVKNYPCIGVTFEIGGTNVERAQLLLLFTPFQKKELVFAPISRISVIETVFLFHVIQTFTQMSVEACQETVHMHDSEKTRN
jgi:hypothetical protein